MRGAGPHAADQGFAKKNGPGKPGPSLGGTVGLNPVASRGFCRFSAFYGAQSPGYGSSPLRIAIRACAIKRRSMVAITRPNSEADGSSPREAVLDIVVPHGDTAGRCISYSANIDMPDARRNSFVCMAAYNILQRSIGSSGPTKGRRKPACAPYGTVRQMVCISLCPSIASCPKSIFSNWILV